MLIDHFLEFDEGDLEELEHVMDTQSSGTSQGISASQTNVLEDKYKTNTSCQDENGDGSAEANRESDNNGDNGEVSDSEQLPHDEIEGK